MAGILWTRLVLAASLGTLAACGGNPGTPNPVPTPIPTPTPTPTPTPSPTPPASCLPVPPPVTRWNVKIHFRSPESYTLDATAFVGPNIDYCAGIGYTDGRSICTVRIEGDPLRVVCESWVVGLARDNGRAGPTWTLGPDDHFCTGPASGCQNTPENQFQLLAYRGGTYKACATNGACGEVQVDR